MGLVLWAFQKAVYNPSASASYSSYFSWLRSTSIGQLHPDGFVAIAESLPRLKHCSVQAMEYVAEQ